MTEIFAPFLSVLGGAIFIDFMFNGGDATAGVFRAIGSIFHGQPKEVVEYVSPKSEQDILRDKIDKLNAELDNLNDELVDAFDEEETKSIEKKIERREKIMQMYLNQLIIKND